VEVIFSLFTLVVVMGRERRGGAERDGERKGKREGGKKREQIKK